MEMLTFHLDFALKAYLIYNLYPNEYNQEFHCYLFSVKLLSNKVCLRNKTEDLNLSIFNMITGINQ